VWSAKSKPTKASLLVTGGEPSLQWDESLREEFLDLSLGHDWYVMMETNGTHDIKGWPNWVTVSPKPPNNVNRCYKYNEIKVVVPYVDPSEYSGIDAKHRFVMPADEAEVWKMEENRDIALRYVLENPEWRMCLQMHKELGVS
jgi:organic radical activating enzyme